MSDLLDVDVMCTTVLDDDTLKARTEYLKRVQEHNQRMDEYIESITFSGNKILLTYMCDATQSMESFMNKTRDVTHKLFKLLKRNFPSIEIRIIIVLY